MKFHQWFGTLAVGLGLLLAGGEACAADPASDPTKVGPDVYKSIFENQRVRVNEITFKPGSKIAMHSHPDHFVYILTPGTLEITNSDGSVTKLEAKAGDAVWLDATSHSAMNPGKTELKAVQVELKEPKPSDAKKADAPAAIPAAKPAKK